MSVNTEEIVPLLQNKTPTLHSATNYMQQDFRPLTHAVVPSCCPLQLDQFYIDMYQFLPFHISPTFPYVNLKALSKTHYK
jgi:hypothetical protein